MKKLDAAKTGIIYSIGADEVTIKTTIGKKIKNPLISRAAHNSLITYAENDMLLNRAVRREHTLLYAGNLPVFAMGTTKIYHSTEPPILDMGDVRLAAHWQGKIYPFTDGDIIKVQHVPNGTKWEISFDALPGIRFCLYASLMGEEGIVATLRLEGKLNGYKEITFTAQLGDCKIAARNFLATWFNELSEKVQPALSVVSQQSHADGSSIAIFGLESDYTPFHERALYGFWCKTGQKAAIQDDKICVAFAAGTDNIFVLSGIHASFEQKLSFAALCKGPLDAQQAINEAEDHFKQILDKARMHTPSKVLNAGLHNAILNHEYGHVGKGWLEGCHWWNCYWTNNYQISAAIALGHYEQAREALLFFGLQEEGYSITGPDGKVLEKKQKKDGSLAWGYDGVPYYIYQLWQYTQQTGDLSVMEEVAEHIHKNVLALMEACDIDGDGLYSWHRGCNSFMYQTDHFAVPGQGASPSLMMAGDFEKFAQLLTLIGKEKRAKFYEQQAERTYKALMKHVWEADEGYFLTTVDLRGDRCRSHYYTDLVFPALYTTLDDAYKLLPLLHLKDSLTFRSETTGARLMRVGEQKPDLFGNNNPMPVQMAETARALLIAGDITTGYELMEACALANSIYTEAPGSSPERLNDFGKGEANFIFGNPAASVAYTAVDGLFGLRITDLGKTLEFAPALPEDFEDWSIALPYAYVSFKKDEKGGTYRLKLPEGSKIGKIRFHRMFSGTKDLNVFFDGEPADFTAVPTLNGNIITSESTISGTALEIRYINEAVIRKDRKPLFMVEGEKCKLTLSENEKLRSGLPGTKTAAGKYYALLYVADQDIYIAQPIVALPRPCISKAELEFTGNAPVLKLQGNAYRGRNDLNITVKIEGKEYQPESISIDKQGNFTAKHTLKAIVKALPAYMINYELDINGKLIAKGMVDGKAIRNENEQYTAEQKDITAYMNADQMNAYNAWRGHGGYPVKPKMNGDQVKAPHAEYMVIPVKAEPANVRVCMLEHGRSNDSTGVIDRLGHPDQVALAVGKSVGAVSLLYAGEVEVRLTGETLGRFVLHYADGSQRILPITAGKNIGSLFSNYAADTQHVSLYPYGEDNSNDSMNHLAFACDPTKVLESLEIQLTKEDCYMAVLAMNLYQ